MKKLIIKIRQNGVNNIDILWAAFAPLILVAHGVIKKNEGKFLLCLLPKLGIVLLVK